MANVNVWGPRLWNILHGLSGLCTLKLNERSHTVSSSHYTSLAKIFDLLRILLPCPLCLESYKGFYESTAKSEQNLVELFQEDKAFEYCYMVHNLVNQKLYQQRRGDLYLGILDSTKTTLLGEAFVKVDNIPTLLVVEKRYRATEKRPICAEDVWISLASFCIHIDKEKTDQKKVQRLDAMIEFCQHLLNLCVLMCTASSKSELMPLHEKIDVFKNLLVSLRPLDTTKALDVLCFAKYETLKNQNHTVRILEDMYSKTSKFYVERKQMKESYIFALNVGSCSTTCS